MSHTVKLSDTLHFVDRGHCVWVVDLNPTYRAPHYVKYSLGNLMYFFIHSWRYSRNTIHPVCLTFGVNYSAQLWKEHVCVFSRKEWTLGPSAGLNQSPEPAWSWKTLGRAGPRRPCVPCWPFALVCVYRSASIVVSAARGSGRQVLVSSARVAGVPPPFMWPVAMLPVWSWSRMIGRMSCQSPAIDINHGVRQL